MLPSSTTDMRTFHVFVSYAHADKRWLDRLKVHLKCVRDLCELEQWDDSRIKSGSKWRQDIREAVDRASAAILLVSADFLASDFIRTDELPPLLAAAEEEGTVILPIIVSPCLFTRTQHLAQFQAVNDPTTPLLNLDPGSQEAVFLRVAERLHDLAQDHGKAVANRSARSAAAAAAVGSGASTPPDATAPEITASYLSTISSESGENFLDTRDFLRLLKLGDWIFDGKRSRIIGTGQNAFLISRREYGDEPFHVSATLEFSNFVHPESRSKRLGMNAGMVFAWKDENQRQRYYNVLLTGSAIFLERNGFKEADGKPYTHLSEPTPFPIVPNQPVDLALDVNADSVRVSAGGRLLIEVPRPSGVLGRVGLRPWRSQMECLKFEVSVTK